MREIDIRDTVGVIRLTMSKHQAEILKALTGAILGGVKGYEDISVDAPYLEKSGHEIRELTDSIYEALNEALEEDK